MTMPTWFVQCFPIVQRAVFEKASFCSAGMLSTSGHMQVPQAAAKSGTGSAATPPAGAAALRLAQQGSCQHCHCCHRRRAAASSQCGSAAGGAGLCLVIVCGMGGQGGREGGIKCALAIGWWEGAALPVSAGIVW